MKILFVSSQFPNSEQPNRGVFSMQIVRELAKIAEVRVIAPLPSLGVLRVLDRFKRYHTDIAAPTYEELESVPIYHPRYLALPGMGSTHHLGYLLAVQRVVKDLQKSWRFDAVNCHWIFPDGVALSRICKTLHVPLMLTPLGTDLNRYTDFMMRRFFIKKAFKNAGKISVLNSIMYRKCQALGVPEDKLVVIPNGVDCDKFNIMARHACRKTLKIDLQERVVLFVGSLVPVKNVYTLLRAFSLLVQKADGKYRLYLAGSGFLLDQLQRSAKDLGIADAVSFLGNVPHDQLPILMNAADCLCLPSLSEGHPNVMMEALACGTPVVGSQVGSIPDFVGEEKSNGFLVDPADGQDLADHLYKCLVTCYDRSIVRNSVADHSWAECSFHYFRQLQGLLSIQ